MSDSSHATLQAGRRSWQTPVTLLILMSVAMPVAFNAWSALLNNFAIEAAAFTGREIGILQSLREIPGFLAFGVVFLLLLFREQTLAYIALLLLGLGTSAGIAGVAAVIGAYYFVEPGLPKAESIRDIQEGYRIAFGELADTHVEFVEDYEELASEASQATLALG